MGFKVAGTADLVLDTALIIITFVFAISDLVQSVFAYLMDDEEYHKTY